MIKYSLDDIKKIVAELALKINAPTNLLPSYGQQTWDAHPYIEVDNLGFMFYIISERGQEYERKMTEKIDDLLGLLSDNWREKENVEHKSILKNYPFDDLAGIRATYFGKLRQQGLSETEISKLAYEKYPEN